ncbi:MAG: cell division protein ZapA [Pseudomonadota bacterium]
MTVTVNITIGGRTFEVACQPGEEGFLRSAAEMLDTEAQDLLAQIGRMTEARLLLMSGLMLADRTAAVEDQIEIANKKIAELEAELSKAQAAPVARSVSSDEIAPETLAGLSRLADEADMVAQKLETKLTLRA